MTEKKAFDFLPIFAFFYLLIPFVIFLIAYVKLIVSIPILIILLWIGIRYVLTHQIKNIQKLHLNMKLLPSFFLLFFWVMLSGIGGFSFQNPDFHARNAFLNDLINYSWPVIYSGNLWGDISSQYILTYYLGYWLPSGLIGKIFGWSTANYFLLIWTFIGIFLVVGLLHRKLACSYLFSALLIMFFSGADILSNGISKIFGTTSYPYLWPPISHLEWSIPGFQYSSFTTQLFWVFNQAIPTWIIVLIILTTKHHKFDFILWSLCFFFAPMPSVGLFPIMILQNFRMNHDWDQKPNPRRNLTYRLRSIFYRFTPQITFDVFLGGFTVFLISFLYFSSDAHRFQLNFITLSSQTIINYFFFVLDEFLILWIFLSVAYKKNSLFYVVGVILLILPFIKIGNNPDLSMRASIPGLMLLMVWTGEQLISKNKLRYKLPLFFMLFLGIFTPIFEINRSIYRTSSFYINKSNLDNLQYSPSPLQPNESLPKFDIPPETDHLNSLWAMDYASLGVFDLDSYDLIAINTNSSLFVKYLMK